MCPLVGVFSTLGYILIRFNHRLVFTIFNLVWAWVLSHFLGFLEFRCSWAGLSSPLSSEVTASEEVNPIFFPLCWIMTVLVLGLLLTEWYRILAILLYFIPIIGSLVLLWNLGGYSWVSLLDVLQFYWDTSTSQSAASIFLLFGKHIFHNILFFSIFINSIRFTSIRSVVIFLNKCKQTSLCQCHLDSALPIPSSQFWAAASLGVRAGQLSFNIRRSHLHNRLYS